MNLLWINGIGACPIASIVAPYNCPNCPVRALEPIASNLSFLVAWPLSNNDLLIFLPSI